MIEERQAQIFGMFAGLAIFVATLGLFGLASFTTERRTKEIGIRKVMGARVRDIVLLLTADFTKLVHVANLLEWPVAYVLMSEWLTRFVYQAPFASWAWLFVAAGVFALMVAFGDAFGAIGPPEVGVFYRWPMGFVVNAALVGRARAALDGVDVRGGFRPPGSLRERSPSRPRPRSHRSAGAARRDTPWGSPPCSV